MFTRLALIATLAAAPALAQEAAPDATPDTTAAATPDATPDWGISTFPGGTLKYQPGFTHLDYVNVDAPKGGEISVWAPGSFDSMNPFTPKGRAAALSSAPYETLLAATSDEIGSSYCLICTTMDYPEDRSEVTFTLRDDVTFSDGTPLTADDVVFSYETFRDKGLSSLRVVMATQVESAEATGPLTVRFVFKTGVSTRDLPATVGSLPIFSRKDFEDRGIDFAESSLEPPLGTGPYILDSMDIGSSVTYRHRDDYWGEDHPLNIGTNNFGTIRIDYFADYDVAFQGFKGGTYTFRNEASSKIWATGYDFPAVRSGDVVKAELADGTIASSQSFIFNLRRDKFADPRVREAIGLMFNFEWSDETLFYGIYDRITSFWENTDLKATGAPGEAEVALLQPLVDDGLLDAAILTDDAVMPPVSGASRQLHRGNLRAASALLDAAGWEVGADGLRRKDGKTLKVEFLNDSQTFDRVLNPYVDNLRRLGVDASLVRVDGAQMTERERGYDFDIITHMMPMDYVPGSGLRQYFGTEGIDDAFNLMGLSDPGIDRLINIVENAGTEEDLHVAIKALDRTLRARRFNVFQYFKPVHTVAYFDYLRHPDPLPPYALGNLSFWWADPEAYDALKAKGAF